jgi:hypothetical protein
MADNFALGGAEADQPGPPISQSENIGAIYKIVKSMPAGRGAHVQQRSDYLMPAPPKQTENVQPAIELTDWGAAMTPGAAIAPAVPSGAVGAALSQPVEDGGFKSGLIDGYPEGMPVPVR